MADPAYDCSDFHSLNVTDICWFVRNTSSCAIDEGFVNYTELLYCTLSPLTIVGACIVLLIWWLFMFSGLAITADDFFCPALAVISQSLKLSHNVAGVTFLAFGNGAPDIFSAIAAIGNAKAGNAGLAIGALFGAGVFVTAVVAGSIAIIHPFTCMQRPFLRDVIFYLGAIFWAFVVMWDKVVRQWEAIGFIVLYLVYVLVVIVGRYVNQRMKPKPRQSIQAGDDFLDSTYDDEESTRLLSPSASNIKRMGSFSDGITFENVSNDRTIPDGLWARFLSGINPINTDEWSGMKIYGKFFEIFKSPLMLLFKLTIPVVDPIPEEQEVADHTAPESLRNWNRLLNSLQLFTGPVFCMFATKVGFTTLGGVFPVWALVMLIGAVLAVVVFATSKTDTRPVYHTAFAYLGFLVAVVWIYSIANEIVNILQALGVVFSLSDAILGLTLLAWGNSIGDLISDTTMARQGYPRMGISACFGGPLFNLLLGLGIPFTLACVKSGEDFKLEVDLEELVLAGGLALSLVVSIVVVPLSGFKMSRSYGIGLVVLYVSFLTIAILTEVNVIPNSKL